jgi:hypothetical protein
LPTSSYPAETQVNPQAVQVNGRSRRRRKPPGATTRGGWGSAHQRRRAAIAPLVNAGQATCCRCTEPIHPGDDWHLDHTDARDGYLGVSHASCNLRDGANKTNGKRPPPPPEKPYKWSQRWYDDPPIGTINLDGGRNPEIYIGNGEWQPL